MQRSLSICSLAFAFTAGLVFACQSEPATNPDHCYNADGDQTCADRFGDEKPFCVSPIEGCGGGAEFGCVAEAPLQECYSPCGNETLVGEDASCLAGGDETESGGDETETGGEEMGTGDGDGDEPEPVCGDGVVEGDEACDDGNTIDEDECSNACTLASCGDGIVQSFLGEACDDGNTISGDTCGSSCVLPGTVIWNRVYDFEQCRGYGVVIASTGNLAATANCDESGWHLLGFDADGELLWNRGTVASNTVRLAVGPSDELVVGGLLNGSQGHVRYYDSEGNYQWSDNLSAGSTVRPVAIDESGAVIAAGNMGSDRFVNRYSPDGTLEWATQEPGGDYVFAVATNATGYVWSVRLNPFQLETYTAAGDPDWASGALGIGSIYGDVAIDPTDNAYVVGQTNFEWESFYLAKFGPTGAPLWTALHDDPDTFEIGYSVAVMPNGGALVAGYTNGDGINPETDGLLSWYTPDGVHLTDIAFDGEANNDADVFRYVAVSSEGYAVAVGYHESTMDGHRLWLVKVAI